jgi:Fe-S cluster assembly iron-binding protein IscA
MSSADTLPLIIIVLFCLIIAAVILAMRSSGKQNLPSGSRSKALTNVAAGGSKQNTNYSPILSKNSLSAPAIAGEPKVSEYVNKPTQNAIAPILSDIVLQLSKGYFTVTTSAVQEISNLMENTKTSDPSVFRIRKTGSNNQLVLVREPSESSDKVVTKNDKKIIFISQTATELLGGVTLDYKDTSEETGFILSHNTI